MPLGQPSLYGIVNSNRSPDNYWGKNQFNSTFPVALACYMKDRGVRPIYHRLKPDLTVEAVEISVEEVFGTDKPTSELHFGFESKHPPYQMLSHDDIGGIDLVVTAMDRTHSRPLEIKLTVLPDSSTVEKEESEWACELVIRPATTKYCGLGMAYSCKNNFDDIRGIFEPICQDVQDWQNKAEIRNKLPDLLSAINAFERQYYLQQKPLLMQPVWKTLGKSPLLADNAFDIFVWSDFALSRLFLDSASETTGRITRQQRSTARLARLIYGIASAGKASVGRIYTEMAFDLQTDKEFAVNGCTTGRYMDKQRRLSPVLNKNVLSEIILNGGEEKLSPERRFDQTVYFTVKND